jgi:hypothetical protein
VTHPDIDAAGAKVIQATRDAGIEYIAIPGFGSGGLEAVAASGSRIINVTGDRGLLYTVFKMQLDETRSALEPSGTAVPS